MMIGRKDFIFLVILLDYWDWGTIVCIFNTEFSDRSMDRKPFNTDVNDNYFVSSNILYISGRSKLCLQINQI